MGRAGHVIRERALAVLLSLGLATIAPASGPSHLEAGSIGPVPTYRPKARRVSAVLGAHPLHLSTAQLVVEETSLYLRIRIFKDDLEGALAAHAGVAEFTLSPTAEADSAFLAYLDSTLSIQADGADLTAAVISSGVDLEAGQGDATVWWYLLEYPTEGPPGAITLLDTVLYERFDDQRNIIRVLHSASGRQRTLYFAAPDDEPVTLEFD
ncbi:MAG: hypothetical protein P8125_05295 [Gemmatimonadota bacterium]